LLSALGFIHSKGIAHRDIKLENILLDDDCQLKLMDFGMYKLFSQEVLKTFCGTGNYMAPEISSSEDKPYEGPPVDIFAIGASLYVMLT